MNDERDTAWFSDPSNGGSSGGKKRRPHVRPVTADHAPDRRPAIYVRKGEIPQMIDAAESALALARGDLYTREGELVHAANAPHGDEEGFPAGAPKLYTLTPPGLTERLARAAQWLKDSAPADPPPPVVHGLIARRFWPYLRPIAGIVQAPTLRPDGSLITERGYDQVTRMLYVPAEIWPDLPKDPTRQDANDALCALFDVFDDFPWENEDGIYVAISAVLTIIARPAITGAVPVFVFDANSPGSGKTLVADTIATIATGREAGRHSYPSDPKGANEEVAKVLTGYAIGGAQVLCWDNLSPDSLFGGPALESVSTARDTASFRILGKSENITIPWRTVMLATGNNVAITRDLERRSLVPRFVARWETADSRPLDTFRHPERFGRLLAWTHAERIRLVGCALTLLRAYHLAGRPSQGLRWASFEEWTELVPSAIVWAGGKSPLACRPSDTGRVSPEREALAVLLRDWPRLDTAGEGITLRSALATLYPERRPGDPPAAPDALDELRDALEVLAPPRGGRAPDASRLAGAFRRLRQVSVGGRALEASTGRGGVSRWLVR